MGMFDNISCRVNLPLNDELKNLSVEWNNVIFQTKDMENCLCDYTITEEGDLLETFVEYEYTYYTEEEKKQKNHKPWNIVKDQKIVKQYNKKLDFHGKITFYESFNFSDVEDIWVDFTAYFIYGKLDKLELAKVEKFENRKITIDDFWKTEKEKTNKLEFKIKKYFGFFFICKKMGFVFHKVSNLFSRMHMFCNRNAYMCIILFLTAGFLNAYELNFSGNTLYTQQTDKRLVSSNNINYKFKLYDHYMYNINLSNVISVDLDCFQKQIKEANVFTTIQIEF